MNTILNVTKSVKAFERIPGPRSLPILGTSWRYLPFIGDLDMNKLHLAGMKKYEEYGELVREEVVPGVYVVNVFNPDDIEQVYKNEGKFPARRSHLGILHYREMRPHIYNNGGLLPVNGSEWWRIRSNFQKSLSKVKEVRMFLNKSDEIFDDFFEKFIRPGKPIDDFLSTIARLNIELTWMALFNKRLGAFEDDNLSADSIPSRLMNSAETANCCILKTDATEPIWKKYKTKKYRLLENCLSFIENIVLKEVTQKQENVLKDKEGDDGFIGQFFSNPNIDIKDINGMAIDLLLGGVDTTSYTSCFIVYHLANNIKAQKKLNEEFSTLLNGAKVTSEILNEAVYSRAILKETFRLNPIAIGISRIMDQDSIMGGYFIPKGTLMLTQNLVACRQEKYFKNAGKFVPERWVKGESEYATVSPYLILPFSHGPRTCIARRLAEQNLLNFILKMGGYKLKWLGGKLDIVTPLICKPDSPVKVQFLQNE